jgi:DNA-binding SARP family transcriptional activator/basic membrane lipoprotein Med (substrate-binding protein (PBP1-ABC) superfamily)
MDFRLLGPLEADLDGQPCSFGNSRARALLALLLLHRNEVLAVDRIVDELWPEGPPKTAEQVVRVYVSQLRKALEPGRLVTRGSGYLLATAPEEVDLDRFDSLRAEGRRAFDAGENARAVEALDQALSLWRGPPLQDFAHESFARSEAARLDELRLTTLEDRFDAQLAVGQDADLVADLEQLVRTHPLRARLRAQLMLALYRSGRHADALEAYERGRRLLLDDFGLEPSDALRQLQLRILQQDPALDGPGAAPHAAETPPPKPPPRVRRKTAGRIAVALLILAAAAGVAMAATAGRSQTNTGQLRVTLVVNQGRSQALGDSARQGNDPIDGLRAATDLVPVHTAIVYGSSLTARFLKTVATAARTSDLVIVEAIPQLEALSRLTRRFPNTRFFVPDSVHDPYASFGGQENVTGVNFNDHENGYLGGYLAGLMTHGSEAVSAVGGFPTQSVRNLIAGFKAGARRARPGVRVLVDYANTFTEQARCERAANSQISRGSAVVFDVAGTCGFGALAAAGIRGKWGLGVDSDLSYVNSQVLASVVKHLDRATQLAVTLFASHRLPAGRDLPLDLSSGSIGLVGLNKRVPDAVRAKVAALEAKLRAGNQRPAR